MWEWTTNNADALTALGTIALVLIGLATGIAAIQTLRQAKRASIEQTRPYVYAKLEPSLGSNKAWDLVIKNTGKTSAQDLTFEVDPWPEHKDELTEHLKELCQTPRTLPPQAKIRTYWNLDIPGEDPTQTSGVTNIANIKAKYRGTETDWKKKPVVYKEDFDLDGTKVGMIPTGYGGVKLEGEAKTPVTTKLQELVKSINNLRHDL